jgi:outer membrane cobalamin receptor
MYEISVAALGYTSLIDTVEVAADAVHEIAVELSASPIPLEPLVTVARRNPFLAGFEERRATGIGTYLDRRDIEARNANRLSDLMRAVPGARVVQLPNGGNGMRLRGGCVPTFWINGVRTANDARLEIPMDEAARPEDVEAIEVYRVPATVPSQFRPEACGVVVLWTRMASTRVGDDKKASLWNRLAILGGFVLVGLVVGGS